MTRSSSDGTPTSARRLRRAAYFASAILAFSTAITGAYMLNRTPRAGGETGTPHAVPLTAEAVAVRAAVARKGGLTQQLTTSGLLRAVREVEIQARVGGTIATIAACNGLRVSQGDTLLCMVSREYRVAFERARAGLLNAQIEFRSLSSTPFLASSDSLDTIRRITAETRALDSLRALSLSGRMDDAVFERLSREREAALAYLTASRGDVIAARSGLAAAREAFETAQLDMAWTTITAPFDGVIADCALSPGTRIAAGQPLFRILDLETVLVDVEILESEIPSIAVGRPAVILPAALPHDTFTGTVLYLNPLVDAKSRTMKVTIALRDAHQPGAALCPGMFATVRIETRTLRDRLVVPRSAVLLRDERPLVFTARGGLARWCYVTAGAANEAMMEILSGIAPGDTVITDGHYLLAHDAPVVITQIDP